MSFIPTATRTHVRTHSRSTGAATATVRTPLPADRPRRPILHLKSTTPAESTTEAAG
jgi:hypothetical protein